jgi:hypothetical protein
VTATTMPWSRASTGLQVGADLPAGPVDRARGRRVGHAHLRRLVQPAAPPRRDHRRPRLHHPHGLRGGLLPSDHPDPPGRDSITTASTKPGAVQVVSRVIVCCSGSSVRV